MASCNTDRRMQQSTGLDSYFNPISLRVRYHSRATTGQRSISP